MDVKTEVGLTIAKGAAGAALAAAARRLLQTEDTELAYELESSTRLPTPFEKLDASGELGSKLAVTVDGAPVRDLHHVVIRLLNRGKSEIREENFRKPLRLRLGEVQIVACDVVDPDLRDKVRCEGADLVMQPAIFDRRAVVRIELLTVGAPDDAPLRVDGRLHNGDIVRLENGPPRAMALIGKGLQALAVASVIGLFVYVVIKLVVGIALALWHHQWWEIATFGIFLGAMGGFFAVLWLLAMLMDRRNWPNQLRRTRT